jgi:hypothetical protein
VTQTRASRRVQLYPAPFEALAYRNLAINPRHVISQFSGANLTSVAAGASGYVTDGHALSTRGATFAVTEQQVASPFAMRPDLKYGMSVGVSTAKSALAISDMAVISVPVKGVRSRHLLWGSANGKSLAVGLMMLSNISGAFYIRVVNSAVNRAHFQKVALAANQETFVSLVFPYCPDGIWTTDNAAGLLVLICLGAGSNYR